MAWFRREQTALTPRETESRVPEGLWVKCTSCKEILYRKDVVKNLSVCPKCGFHFRSSARERLETLFEGPWQEFDQNLVSADPLAFRDTKAYADRLKDGRAKTNSLDALVSAVGEMDGRPAVVAAMEYGFIGGSMGVVVGEKVTRAIEKAQASRLPLVVVSCSGGARMMEGTLSLVPGGASGLGGATARTLAAAGGNVVILDVNAEAGQKLAAELGPKAHFVRTDVTSEPDVKKAVAAATERFSGLNGAVNAAGIGTAEKVLGKNGPHSLDLFEKTIRINLVGTFNVIRLAAGAMAATAPTETGERGVIVNTASVAAFDGQIGQAAYSASKGGIVGMTLPIARELARSGIRVMTIAPGIFDTPLLAGLPEPARISLGQQVPFPSRLGRPDEYAAQARGE